MRDTLLAKYASCTIEYPGLIERFAGVVESCTCITRYRSLMLFFKQSFQCTTHPLARRQVFRDTTSYASSSISHLQCRQASQAIVRSLGFNRSHEDFEKTGIDPSSGERGRGKKHSRHKNCEEGLARLLEATRGLIPERKQGSEDPSPTCSSAGHWPSSVGGRTFRHETPIHSAAIRGKRWSPV